jgi:hypothetical protein
VPALGKRSQRNARWKRDIVHCVANRQNRSLGLASRR